MAALYMIKRYGVSQWLDADEQWQPFFHSGHVFRELPTHVPSSTAPRAPLAYRQPGDKTWRLDDILIAVAVHVGG